MEVDTSEAYNYINTDVLTEFKGAGMQTLLQFIEAREAPDVDSAEIIATIFTELLMVLQQESLKVDDIVEFLSMCIRDEETAMIFCQVLNLFPGSLVIEDLLKQLYASQNIIKTHTMVRYISVDTIGKLGIIPQDAWTRQLNMKKRDELYTQKKFNLFHEEPEGFAKIMAEFTHILQSGESEYQIEKALEIADKTIGHYNLDPSRAFDVIFNCFSNDLVSNITFIIGFLKRSRWWPQLPSDNSSIDTLSTGGNQELAKVVGLNFLQLSEGKSSPETFKLLTAILIKENFFSFGSLYPFFGRSEDEMDELEKLYNKKLEDEVFKSSANALALAAPLLDDEDEDSGKKNNDNKTGEATQSPEELLASKLASNLKYQMLRACLTVGLYWPSVFILSKYPYLALIDDEIGLLISRLFHYMLSPTDSSYQPFSPSELEQLQTKRKVTLARRNNEVAFEDSAVSTFLTFKATIQNFNQKAFVFFYDRWTDELPMIYNSADLFRASKGLLKFLNVTYAKDVMLFSKICDFGAKDLENGGDKEQWFIYFRNFVFPAISVLEGNSLAVDKAFKVLSFYPKEDRFNLYSEFHQVTSKNNPYIKITYGKAEKSTKDVLKRLSKETVKPMMRRIAKISFANPLPCFLTILQQIESYDNLNTLVVETARYFNAYGWDVLTLAIMIRITMSGRSNIQNNGLFERQWIQSLASFIGKICHKYPTLIDVSTLLEFLLKSLHSKDTTGLIVLKEMLQSMGGLTSNTNLTLDQIYKLNSGEVLRKSIYQTIHDTRYENVKPATVLVKRMIELDCVNEFLVLLCQLNDTLAYEDDDIPLKVIANRKDDLSAVTQLFCDLLNFVVKDQSVEFLKPISELTSSYKVPSEWVFEVWRKYLQTEPNGSQELVEQVTQSLQNDVWTQLSPQLYCIFWQLSLYDISYMENLYTQLLTKHTTQLASLESAYQRSRRVTKTNKEQIDTALRLVQEKKQLIEQIEKDQESHKNQAKAVDQRFEEESESWLRSEDNLDLFLQYCLLPRSVHSSFGAVYAAKFIFKLFKDASGSTLFGLLDKLLCSRILLGTLFTSTLMESENLGLFFCELLSTLNVMKLAETNNYKQKVHDYHVSILNDLSRSLKSKDYMCRRNAIIFLKNIVSIYPVVEDHCEQLVEIIDHIITTEEREDLKLAANALIGHLKSRKSSWVHLWDFVDLDDEQLAMQKEKRQRIKDEEERLARKEKERKEALAKAEAERLAKIKAEKIKAENEKKEKERLTYSDSGSQTRPVSRDRSNDTGKGKVDYYSKYASTATKQSTPADTPVAPAAPAAASAAPAAVSSGGEANGTKRNKDVRTSYVPSKARPSAPAAATAPTASNKKEGTPKRSTPPQQSQQKDVRSTEGYNKGYKQENSRKPLPPQSSLPKDTRSKDPKQQSALPPPPPPPPPPEAPAINTAKDTKTREPLPPQSSLTRDSNKSHSSGGRQRTPLPPQHSAAAASTSSSWNSNSSRRPQTYDNRGGYNRDRDWYNQRQKQHSRPASRGPDSHRSTPTPTPQSSKDPLPPPPPPPPPPSLPTGPKDNGYNNKRKYDHSQGNDRDRGYDKRYKHR